MKKKLMALLVTAVMIGSCFTALANRGGYFEVVEVYQKDLKCAGNRNTTYYFVEGSSVLEDSDRTSIVAVFDSCRVMITGMEGGEYLDTIWEDGVECAVISSTTYNPAITTGFYFTHYTRLYGEFYYTLRYDRLM